MARDQRAAAREAEHARGDDMRMAVVCGRFNGGVTERLLDGTVAGLTGRGVGPDDIEVVWVPGAFEIPLAAKRLALSGRFDAVIALGAVIRGETGHYEFVAGECARGLQQAQLDTGVPVVFGVLTTETVDQALARSGSATNKGDEAAETAIDMVDLLRTLPERGG